MKNFISFAAFTAFLAFAAASPLATRSIGMAKCIQKAAGDFCGDDTSAISGTTPNPKALYHCAGENHIPIFKKKDCTEGGDNNEENRKNQGPEKKEGPVNLTTVPEKEGDKKKGDEKKGDEKKGDEKKGEKKGEHEEAKPEAQPNQGQ
ncbi:hypothetical protein G7Y89_g4031 [Cudoniella acicularis]|uniref:Uncharacterized protein n=1 Tax=Cudoniella acicularis TaxID=354080 RepID=A0A8H4W5D8_9HELO|nr:hypothetical protein G7Y89_g4031 [Cudoniella acicularis]